MQCVILAGGLATRMGALTKVTPKALLPVAGAPFADLQLRWLADQGVTDVVYCIAHLGDRIRDVVGEGGRWGLRVTYADEGDRRLGTAGAVRLAVDTGLTDDRFLVLYGDSFLHVDVAAVWAAYRASGRDALMTVYRNDVRHERCNVRYTDGVVVAYEKGLADPAGAGMHHVDYGLLAFSRAVIAEQVPPGEVHDLAAVQHRLAAAGRMAGFEASERFYEIGSPTGLAELEAALSPRSGAGRAT